MKSFWIFIFAIAIENAFSQNSDKNLEAEYNKGVQYLSTGMYAKADSAFSHVLKKNKIDIDSYVNRAIARKKLGNKCGYCTDLFSATELGDKESYSSFWKDCPTYDSIFSCEKGKTIKLKINQATENIDVVEWKSSKEAYGISHGYAISSIKLISIINKNENLNAHFFINGLDTIFCNTKESPKFSGGVDSLKKYLSNAIQNSLQEKKVKSSDCSLVLYFTIDEDGNIKDISRTLFNENETNTFINCNFKYEDEAVKIIRAMPKWMPGKYNGRLIKVRRAIQIQFNSQWAKSIPDYFLLVPR